MPFQVFTDGSANMPQSMREGVTILPCEYYVDGETRIYDGDIEHFDSHAYFEELRSGKRVTTSLLNAQLFLNYFTPVLENGEDVIYVAMSSGISGTYGAASVAAMELNVHFPDRYVHIVDSHGCGFGSGLLAEHAAQLNAEGVEVHEAARILDEEVPHICQYFTVDDLNFLKRTGRVSGTTAAIATVLNIKPILYGDSTGHIVACMKTRGRRRSIEALAKKYQEKRLDLPEQTVCISHGDCIEDAKILEALVLAITPKVKMVICEHEPFSGSHVGPGMLGLFFRGKER